LAASDDNASPTMSDVHHLVLAQPFHLNNKSRPLDCLEWRKNGLPNMTTDREHALLAVVAYLLASRPRRPSIRSIR
jgi:hypothetical protein